jgi:hypothetical protein
MNYEHRIIILKKTDQRCEKEECKLVNISLNAYIGDINVRTQIKCFDGWNKRGLNNHIEKVLGLKNGIFKLYTSFYLDEFRSIMFHGTFHSITVVYQVGFIEDTGINFISVESMKNLCF